VFSGLQTFWSADIAMVCVVEKSEYLADEFWKNLSAEINHGLSERPTKVHSLGSKMYTASSAGSPADFRLFVERHYAPRVFSSTIPQLCG